MTKRLKELKRSWASSTGWYMVFGFFFFLEIDSNLGSSFTFFCFILLAYGNWRQGHTERF